MLQKKKNSREGSVLVFTLFIMLISLVVSMGIITTAGINRKSSISTNDTIKAIQIVNRGLERALFSIKASQAAPLWQIGGGAFVGVCINNEIVEILPNNGGTSTLVFYDASDNQLTCLDLISSIKTIKSIGEYRGAVRAMMVTLP